MNKILFVISFICLGIQAFAQEPVTQDSVKQQPIIYEHTTYDTVYQVPPTAQVSVPQQAQEHQGITVLEPENMVLKAGVENTVRIKLEKVGANKKYNTTSAGCLFVYVAFYAALAINIFLQFYFLSFFSNNNNK